MDTKSLFNNIINESMQKGAIKLNKTFKSDHNVLLFADDGLLLTDKIGMKLVKIKFIQRELNKIIGLKMNNNKREILVFWQDRQETE